MVLVVLACLDVFGVVSWGVFGDDEGVLYGVGVVYDYPVFVGVAFYEGVL